MSLNIVFAGTPDFAARHLAALISSEHNVIAVYSQPDRPAGRGKKLQASAVKQIALEHNIPVFQPENFKTEQAQTELAELNADIMVVVAYGLLLPKTVLDTPKLGCINVHGSLLPKWRGAAPIQRSIWAGDQQTGITIMQMDEGLDTGDMLLIKAVEIESDDTSASLYEKLAQIGPQALLESLAQIANKTSTAVKQDDSQANYAKKLTKEEALIDWNHSAAQLERNIRAFNPWPVAYFELDDKAIKVHQAQVMPGQNNAKPGTILAANKNGILVQTAEQALNITQLQIPGKKAMPVSDILNARQDWFIEGAQL
ncbi:methionyl-tRNA formyltransferase [Catenovulum sp. 2E275]|uniref:methionyl-tRNA formyltransferase n=1 Tax=Catenovulum sp. 2E275 TaxID=2980497 RepID=UPI0021CF7511|nr:methionyl-tRNA formyltransferase [Catenovulum sp. 2E275]MCU4675876.1 methionyl-tRNA formyltransferase [Catenovulum sp. 2E275]